MVAARLVQAGRNVQCTRVCVCRGPYQLSLVPCVDVDMSGLIFLLARFSGQQGRHQRC